jgi:hypothetical protein
MPTLQLFRRLTGFGLVLSLFVITAPMAGGADTTAVEEEWQLDLSVPNIVRSSPQLNCFMSPTGDTQSYYTVFLINQHGSEGGGLELQLWNGSTLLSSSNFSSSSLSSEGERIQWTSRMELSNSGVLTAQILSGTSTTWGRFSRFCADASQQFKWLQLQLYYRFFRRGIRSRASKKAGSSQSSALYKQQEINRASARASCARNQVI